MEVLATAQIILAIIPAGGAMIGRRSAVKMEAVAVRGRCLQQKTEEVEASTAALAVTTGRGRVGE